MDNQEIQHLISLGKQGDKHAFSALVRYFQPKIFTLAFRMLCDEEEAKDAVQETFLKAWLQLNTYNPDFHFSTWLYKIASNVCLDKLKSFEKSHSTKITDIDIQSVKNQSNIETEIINKELAETVRRLTERLSSKQKIVFTLRYLEELEIEEITQITGLSAAKIKSNLYLARQTITNQLRNDEK